MPTPLELRTQRARLAKQAEELLNRAEAENRDLTAEEEQQWNRIQDEIDELGRRIERLERISVLGEELRQSTGTVAGGRQTAAHQVSEEEEREAFIAWIKHGTSGLTPEQRQVLEARYTQLSPEMRALGVATGAAGGFTVPQGFYRQLIEAQQAIGGVRLSRATVLTTDAGNDLPVPTSNDTANVGARVDENTQIAEQDTGFGSKVFKAYMYTSKIVRVSIQLLQDSAFDIEAFLARLLGERIGRALNADLTTGTGTGQPQGVVTAAAQGKVGTTGQTTSVTYEDLVDLEHSVDPAYRANAQWMFHDTTLRALKKLKDSQGRPLWQSGLAVREPDTILGYPYVINQNMPQMAANAKSILFGDFRNYFIRDVRDVTVLRLQERYADYLQVGFLAFSRHDGGLVNAGTDPIKYYQNSAT